MMPMVALERLWCSMAAIICVVRLVLGGHGARATGRAAMEHHKRSKATIGIMEHRGGER